MRYLEGGCNPYLSAGFLSSIKQSMFNRILFQLWIGFWMFFFRICSESSGCCVQCRMECGVKMNLEYLQLWSIIFLSPSWNIIMLDHKVGKHVKLKSWSETLTDTVKLKRKYNYHLITSDMKHTNYLRSWVASRVMCKQCSCSGH